MLKRAPSLTRLEAAFPGKGTEVRALLKGEKKTRDYASVKALVDACYNPPSYKYRLMTALNEILEGYGVETLSKNGVIVAEFINFGDCYDTTLLLKVDTCTVMITSWGDFVESNRL